METTIVIDNSVFCHQLHGLIAEDYQNTEHFLGLIKAQLLYLQSGDWLGVLKPKEFQTILAFDWKPYWRSEYLQRPEVSVKVPRRLKKDREKAAILSSYQCVGLHNLTPTELEDFEVLSKDLAIAYKAGRKFPEYSFTKLKKCVSNIASEMGWLQMGRLGFEADDIAASIVQANNHLPESERNRIILLTIDTDWMGLINEHTTWFCMHGYPPRVRDLSNYNTWVARRLNTTVDTPRQIWDIKAVQGDKSDNLPPGSPLEVIDLLSPPIEFDLNQQAGWTTNIQQILTNHKPVRTPNVLLATQYLKQMGVPLAVRPYMTEVDLAA